MGNYCCRKRDFQVENYDQITETIKERINAISFQDNSEIHQIRSRKEILASYQILKKIGQGLFSKVYLANDATGKKVALKLIKKSNFVTKETIQKIIIEKEILKIVDHDNILKLYRTLQTNTRILYVLEYAGKGNLVNLLNIKMRLKPEEIKFIAAQIIEALIHIHSKGIIYGDLKAENVLLNNKGIVKLCDFNLSGTSSLLSDTVQGTVNYIAPEVIEGKPRTPKSDFWSLGVLIHLLFYRRFPFKSAHQSELFFNVINKNIEPEPRDNRAPNELRQLICDLLIKDPRKRLGDRLQEFVKHPFFANFDWKRYKEKQDNFNYVADIPSFEDELESNDNQSSDDELEAQLNPSGSPNKFLYNINGFTYENNIIPSESVSLQLNNIRVKSIDGRSVKEGKSGFNGDRKQ